MNASFLQPSDPLLTRTSTSIPYRKINSEATRTIIQAMLKIIQEEQKSHKKGVGLAAPQIGILKRIILVDVKADRKGEIGDLKIYINPEITWKSKREEEWYEGCFSTSRVCGIVSRPTSIKVQSFVLTPPEWEAKLVEEKHTGYIARIFQHEIDHLDGKVFVNHIKNPDKLHWVTENEFPIYRKGGWKTWPKKCSFKKWEGVQKPLAIGSLKKV